jgi:hypothetical protein
MLRSHPFARWPATLAFTAASLVAAHAAADTSPVVRIVPTGPVVLRPLPPAAPAPPAGPALPGAAPSPGTAPAEPAPLAPPTAYLDRNLPAGEPFDMELALPGKSDVYPSVEIWPLEEQQDTKHCAATAPTSAGVRQSYRLGMRATGTDKDRVFVAKVPALQVGQEYCFKVNVSSSLEAGDLSDVATSAAGWLMRQPVLPGKSCFRPGDREDADLPAYEDALAAALRLRGPQLVDGVAPARAALDQFHRGGEGKCNAVVKEQTGAAAAADEVAKKETLLDTRKAEVRALPLLDRAPAPLVRVGDNVTLATALLTDAATVADVNAAAADLRVRAGRHGAPHALDRWATLLQRFAREIDGATPAARKKAADEARREAARIAPLPAVQIWNGTDFESLETFREHPEALGADRVAAQLKTIAASLAKESKEEREKADRWIAAFETLGKARAALDDASAGRQKAAAAALKAEDDLRKALESAFTSEGVRQALLVRFSVLMDDKAGHGKTPDAANYAALDAGMVVAFPSGGSTSQPWILPYLGFNFYTTAVDRKISLDDLTGGASMRFRQRVSLTLGVTLTAPALVGRTVQPLVLDRYPLAAIGVRLTTYVRLTGGGVFYKLADKNPASAGESLHVAPFVGMSADVDLLHILGLNPKL